MTLLIAPLRLRLKVNILLVFIRYLVQIDKSNVVTIICYCTCAYDLYLTGQFYLLDYLPLTTSKSIWQVQGLTPINHACFFSWQLFSYLHNIFYCSIFILLFPPMLILLHTSGLNFFIVNTDNITISKDQYKQQMFLFCLHYLRRLSWSPQ